MEIVSLKLVVIVAEAVLEHQLVSDLNRLGARGHTLVRAEGEGQRGMRVGGLEGGNIRLETIVSGEVADKIMTRLASRYFENYAIIAYQSDVGVVRGNKYV
ncbi:MAG: hypothetical protein U5L04_05155 [Trueperaceae bacterium]|nr:hypothetical protein [Trueperaceae bacterium]